MAFNDKGFIIDAPKVLLETVSGNSHLATAQQGQVTFGGESIEITGGWSFYNLAEIDTKKTLNISLTDAQWDYDQLWLTSGGAKTTGASEYYYFGTAYTIDSTTYAATLTGHTAVASSIEINGFTEIATTTPTASEFWVSNSGSDTVVHFAAANAGVVVYPSYKVATTATTDILTVQTVDFAAAGSAIIQFPIYSDADAADSTIIAYAQIQVYKCKIMPTYEFSGQYKQASTFKLDLKGLDPRRTDSNMWQMIIVPV
jgi:hypothetical protein